MKRFNCFIDSELASLILRDKSQFASLSMILSKYATLNLNSSKNEVEAILKDENNPITINFRNDPAVDAFPRFAEDQINAFKKDTSLLKEQSFAMVILDSEIKLIENIRNKIGVTAFSKESLLYKSDHFFVGSFYKQFKKGQKINNAYNSFIGKIPGGEDPQKFNLYCSNAIVISDPYIFKNSKIISGKNYFVGFENLKLILDALLPLDLDVPFNLTILTENCTWDVSTANKKLKELEIYLKKIRKYKITLEFVIYSMSSIVHGRYLLSNYYKITFDKGLNHFSVEDSCTIVENNDIRIERNFDNVNSIGDIPFQSSLETLNDIKKICENAYSFTKLIGGNVGNMAINSEGSSSIINRLLQFNID